MDKQEFEYYLNFSKYGTVPEDINDAMKEYVQKMHSANERLELIEARLLGQFDYEQNEVARQIIAAYLGYDPREVGAGGRVKAYAYMTLTEAILDFSVDKEAIRIYPFKGSDLYIKKVRVEPDWQQHYCCLSDGEWKWIDKKLVVEVRKVGGGE